MTGQTMMLTVGTVDDGGRMVRQDNLPFNLRDDQYRPEIHQKTQQCGQQK